MKSFVRRGWSLKNWGMYVLFEEVELLHKRMQLREMFLLLQEVNNHLITIILQTEMGRQFLFQVQVHTLVLLVIGLSLYSCQILFL